MKPVLALAVLLGLAAPAAAWDIDKMNAQIEQTNVIVSGICSGTVIDTARRLILTAHHCITDSLRETEKEEVDPITGEIRKRTVMEKAPMYIETWKRQDFDVVTSETHAALIRGWDDQADIAILEVIDTDWKAAQAAPLAPDTFQYKRGVKVYAVGNPGITFDNSLTEGIISAPARKLDLGRGKVPFFQMSAGVIGGNSGGAIYNEEGEIIGTLSAGVRGSSIGLAVPVSKTKELLRKLNLVAAAPAVAGKVGYPY